MGNALKDVYDLYEFWISKFNLKKNDDEELTLWCKSRFKFSNGKFMVDEDIVEDE